MGWSFLKNLILNKWLYKKIAKYDLKVLGVENLKGLNGSYVIASNHVKPRDGGLLKSGISPDSFIIHKVVFDYTGKQVAVAANYILGVPYFLREPLEFLTRGFIRGFGLIPVGEGRESFHNVFLKSVEKVVSEKRPILIYPVGRQEDDFVKSQEIKAGAAYIALKYNLSVVPTYIRGPFNWQKNGQGIYLVFGKPFYPNGLKIDQINEKIKTGILALKFQTAN